MKGTDKKNRERIKKMAEKFGFDEYRVVATLNYFFKRLPFFARNGGITIKYFGVLKESKIGKKRRKEKKKANVAEMIASYHNDPKTREAVRRAEKKYREKKKALLGK